MKKVDPDAGANCTVFGQHLVELHFEDKVKKIIRVGQKNCNLCDKKCKSEKMLMLHVGVSHGFAMKFYRSFVKDNRIRKDGRKVSERKPHVAMGIKKKCKFCKKLIAGSGSSWQNNMYNHYSRRHFPKLCSEISQQMVGKLVMFVACLIFSLEEWWLTLG